MKTRRFFSLFLALLLSLALVPVPAAATEETAAASPPEIHCEAMLLVDANTGKAVYEKNAHERMYPASLTKIMTALLVLEAVDDGQLSLTQQLTASHSAMTAGLEEDGSTAGILEGETMTVEQFLYCMLVVSANEACNVLAEAVAGDIDTFVEKMNAKAQELGCENTHFVNPTGLHDPQHYTSAWDLYLITKEAMTHSDFMRFCDTSSVTIPATNLSEARTLHTTNYLIDGWRSRGYINKDAHGVKTGSTSDAGHCLVSTATRGSMSFISVVLGGDRVTLDDGEIRTYSFYDTNLLFNWAFDNFSYQTVLSAEEPLKEVPVALSKVDHVNVHVGEDVEILLPKGLSPEDLEQKFSIEEPVEAPVKADQKLGTLELSYDGTVYATVDLLAYNDVEASRLLTFWQNVKDFFSGTVVRVIAIIVVVLLLALLIWKVVFGRRRYRYGHSVGRGRNRGYRGRRR